MPHPLNMLATQDILTYCANRTLTYHLYADESGLLVLETLVTSVSLSKNKFFDRLRPPARPGVSLSPGTLLYFDSEQTVAVAVVIDIASAPEHKPGLSI